LAEEEGRGRRIEIPLEPNFYSREEGNTSMVNNFVRQKKTTSEDTFPIKLQFLYFIGLG